MNFNPLHFIYLPRRAAIGIGFTYEGRMFGVPAWIALGSHNNEIFACPKVPALMAWTLLVDAVMELATYFMTPDQCIETPIRIVCSIHKAGASQ